MSQCRTPYATGSGTFPPMKRCTRRSAKGEGPCKEHQAQLDLFERPGAAATKAKYRRLVVAFEVWEEAVKQSKGQSSESIRVRDAARALIAAARGEDPPRPVPPLAVVPR